MEKGEVISPCDGGKCSSGVGGTGWGEGASREVRAVRTPTCPEAALLPRQIKGRTFVQVLGRTWPHQAHSAWLWPCWFNSLESRLRGAVDGYGLGRGCHCPGERLGGDGVTVAVGWREQNRMGRWRGLSDEGKRGSGTTYSHRIPRGWHLVGAL